MICYQPISEERRKQLQVQLADANKKLSSYFEKISFLKGRKGFVTFQGIKLNKHQYFNEILNESKKNPGSDLFLHRVLIPASDVETIIAVEQIKSEVLSSIVGMFAKLANKKNKTARDSSISFEDLQSEATASFLSSFYSYCDHNVCFTTYFYTCASRHINSICNKSNPMSKLNKKSIQLKRKFIETKKSLSRDSSYNEIIEMMNLTNKEAELLKSALVASSKISSFDESSGLEKHFAGIDGTKQYFASGSSRGKFILSSEDNNNLEKPLGDMELQNMNLSELEKAVLEGVMKSHTKLGINSVAKNLINPKTNKPFSRMAITYAWRRIKDKIAKFKEAA